MSLSSFLLKAAEKSKDKGKAIDTGLDELFRTNTAVVTAPSAPAAAIKPAGKSVRSEPKDKKRKHVEEVTSIPKPKKLKATSPESKKYENTAPSSKKSKQPAKAARSSSAERKHSEHKSSPGESEDDAEEPKASTSKAPSPPVKQHDDSDEPDSDDEGDPSKLVHETVSNAGKHKHGSSRKSRYVPEEETREQREARTVFVGNVSIEVAKTKPLQKQLKRHLLSFAPTAKIESVRFRSVAFSKPTIQLPPVDGSVAKPKDTRQHDRDRAASWRAVKGKTDNEASGAPEKTFLTPAEKKRIAFINQEFHEGVDAVNAYVVFAHSAPNASKKMEVMDPYEAALRVAKEADGTAFGGRTIRTDLAVKGGVAGKMSGEMLGDPKATVFIGNLDFASKEEDLRTFLEVLMVEERGKPGKAEEEEKTGDESDEEDEDEEKNEESDIAKEESSAEAKGKAKDAPPALLSQGTWVKRVRIIRDKDTLLGKGFAYVQFTARDCVDEILALEPERLKFAKRKLRVQRCKTLPGASKPVKASKPAPAASTTRGKVQADRQAPPVRASQSKGVPTPVSAPRGDPRLGERLVGLSKEERKRAKATDADRVARRLAKKRANALAEKGVKSRASAGKVDVLKARKKPGETRKGAAAKGSAAKKGRVRSEKALAKMNLKK